MPAQRRGAGRIVAVGAAAAGCAAAPCYRGRSLPPSADCLRRLRQPAVLADPTCSCTADTDYATSAGAGVVDANSTQACCAACSAHYGCVAGVWQQRNGSSKCFLKGGTITAKAKKGVIACRVAATPAPAPPPPPPPPPAGNVTPSPPSPGCHCTAGVDYSNVTWGETLSGVNSTGACCAACSAHPDCFAGVWQRNGSKCFLKAGGTGAPRAKKGVEACRVHPETPAPPPPPPLPTLPPTGDVTLLFDARNTTHAVDGFGAMVWADQEYGYREFEALNIKYIRTVQDSASTAQLQALRNVTDTLGIQWVYVLWSAPRAYVTDGMLSDVAGFASHWVDVVASLDADGVRPHYLDLMNEPDSNGAWSTGISPANYNALVKSARAKLDAAGFRDVRITGPGLSALSNAHHAAEWISALDDEAAGALSVWANHMWDDGDLCHGGAGCVRRGWADDFGPAIAAARSPRGATKRVWITEYATKESTLHGEALPRPDDTGGYSAAGTMAFAARVFQNTLALLNAGASATFYWEAEDELGKSWGYVTRGGVRKPVYSALLALFPKVPAGARVVAPPPAHAAGVEGIGAAAFVAPGGRVTVALANDAAAPRRATVQLRGAAPAVSVVEAVAVQLGQRGDPAKGEMDTAETVPRAVSLRDAGGGAVAFDAVLPPDSTLTVVLG